MSCINCHEELNYGGDGGLHEFIINTTSCNDEETDQEFKPSTITIKQALVQLFNKLPSFNLLMNHVSSSADVSHTASKDLQMCTKCGNLTSSLYHTLIKLIEQQQGRRFDSQHNHNNFTASTKSVANTSLIEQFISGLLPIPMATTTTTKTKYEDDDNVIKNVVGSSSRKRKRSKFIKTTTTTMEFESIPEQNNMAGSASALQEPSLDQLQLHYLHQHNGHTDDDVDEQVQGDEISVCNFDDGLDDQDFKNNNAGTSPNIAEEEEEEDPKNYPCTSPTICFNSKKVHCQLFTHSDRDSIHSMFWTQFKTLIQRQEYVRSLVDFVPVAVRSVDEAKSRKKGTLIYHLIKKVDHGTGGGGGDGNNIVERRLRVCPLMFRKTLGLRDGRVHTWIPKTYFTGPNNSKASNTSEDVDVVKKPSRKNKVRSAIRKGCAAKGNLNPAKIYRLLLAGPTSPVVLLRPTDKVPSVKRAVHLHPDRPVGETLNKSTCPTCSQSFNYKWALALHQLAVHDGVEPKTCDLCGFKSYHYIHDAAHFTSHKCTKDNVNPAYEYGCDYCGKKLSTLSAYKCHAWSHDNHPNDYNYNRNSRAAQARLKKFPCTHPNCTRSFTLASFLSNHIHRVHVLGMPDKEDQTVRTICTICGEVRNKKNLGHHMKRMHPSTIGIGAEEKAHVCPTCGKSFRLGRDLNGHIKRVHVDVIKPTMACPVCGRIIKKGSYRLHMARRHNPNKPPRKKRTTKPKL